MRERERERERESERDPLILSISNKTLVLSREMSDTDAIPEESLSI